jgi:hypothetical protein
MSNIAVFNLPDLVYRIAHDYPGGIPALAVRMDKSPNVLNKKVDPRVDTHHTTVDELTTILDFADADKRFTHALCANQGGVFVQTDHLDGVSDMALLETFTNLMAEFGKFSNEFHQALSDNKVTKAEVAKVRQAMHGINAASAALLARFESLAEDNE